MQGRNAATYVYNELTFFDAKNRFIDSKLNMHSVWSIDESLFEYRWAQKLDLQKMPSPITGFPSRLTDLSVPYFDFKIQEISDE